MFLIKINILLLFSLIRLRFDTFGEAEKELTYLTQSQNTSAKIALVLDPLEPIVHQNPPEIFSSWNRIDEKSIYTSHQGIATSRLNFYSKMIQKTAVGMIETGIMGNLVDTRVLKLKKPKRKGNRQKLLNFEDFLIYLELFLGVYGFSVIAFVFELFLSSKIFRKIVKFVFARKISTNQKFDFAKVHEDKDNKSNKIHKLNSNLIEKFRIKNVIAESSGSVVLHERNLEEISKVFGENIAKSEKIKDEKQKVEEFESIIKMLTTKAN